LKNCFVLFLLIISHAQLFSQRSSLQQLHYTINVQLDDRHNSLDGSLQLKYINLSSDTLQFIWFQLWPNAFKNDRTAYSDQMLDSGNVNFYFSQKEQKGYINRLVFRVDNEVLQQEDHPRYADIIKVHLLHPLLPQGEVIIHTPFHVQLPYNFSGFGYMGHSYEIRNWYPAAAWYDVNGWKPEPFTGQPQRVIADYDVTVSLPKKYILTTNAQPVDSVSADTSKTLRFHSAQMNDFAWSVEKPGTPHPAHKKTFDERFAEAIPRILSKQILPTAGYNVYDGLQAGILVHNFHLPEKTLTYFAAPMYAFSSKKITGFAGLNYNIPEGNYFKKISIGFNASRFSSLKGNDSTGSKISAGFYKAAPYIRFSFPAAGRHVEEWLEFRTFIIGEKDFDYVRYSVDSFYYPSEGKTKTRYLNQLTFNHASYRALYPYDAQLQIQQSSAFYRINGEAHYFFNYARGGGLQARVFASKFGYIGKASSNDTYRYQPKLTAVRGDEDYTYSNAFVGRNEFEGLASQQVMLRDGGFKLRTDMFQDLQGRSDNWIASMNLNTSFPVGLFPAGFPLKIFLDAGTYAEAWKKESSQPRFLYVSGLQLSVFKNLLNIYAPLLYSKVFRDNLKTVPEENTFFKRISFSIDFSSFLATRAPRS
jgi:hypothetical protein